MTDTRARAVKARQELEITAGAFSSLEAKLIQAALDAETAEAAFEAVLARRVLQRVRQDMQTILDTDLMNEEANKYA